MGEVVSGHDTFNPSVKFWNTFIFVEERYNDCNINVAIGIHRKEGNIDVRGDERGLSGDVY